MSSKQHSESSDSDSELDLGNSEDEEEEFDTSEEDDILDEERLGLVKNYYSLYTIAEDSDEETNRNYDGDQQMSSLEKYFNLLIDSK